MKALRSYKKPEAYGAERKTLEVDGFTRLWDEYVPEAVKKEGKPVPLVVCMHGRGGSAESFFDLSGMSCVAEERGFILLIPEASISQQKKNGIQNLLLWNGAYQGKEIDDTRFVLKMIDDVKSRYAIDEERIYACGQSSGGMMTSELALRAPQVFAAVSPWSALKSPDREVPLPERILGLFGLLIPLAAVSIITNGFGMGDVKLCAAFGWTLGAFTAYCALAAALTAAVLAGKITHQKRLPLAPYLCGAGMAAILIMEAFQC